ncbi:hypothetical protein ACULLL_01820 [Lysinibacillus irui]|uniref:hypothetical protein n=1 Tax=Lysinibacillus irui TaxID=2998077 RepID=UPI004044D92D
MKKQGENLGFAVSKVLYEFGDAFNPSKTLGSEVKLVKVYIDDDREALKTDWNTVGDEVRISIENYGETNSRGIKRRITAAIGSC